MTSKRSYTTVCVVRSNILGGLHLLEDKCNKLLDKGYDTLGSPVIIRDVGHWYLTQAFTKTPKEEI